MDPPGAFNGNEEDNNDRGPEVYREPNVGRVCRYPRRPFTKKQTEHGDQRKFEEGEEVCRKFGDQTEILRYVRPHYTPDANNAHKDDVYTHVLKRKLTNSSKKEIYEDWKIIGKYDHKKVPPTAIRFVINQLRHPTTGERLPPNIFYELVGRGGGKTRRRSRSRASRTRGRRRL